MISITSWGGSYPIVRFISIQRLYLILYQHVYLYFILLANREVTEFRNSAPMISTTSSGSHSHRHLTPPTGPIIRKITAPTIPRKIEL